MIDNLLCLTLFYACYQVMALALARASAVFLRSICPASGKTNHNFILTQKHQMNIGTINIQSILRKYTDNSTSARLQRPYVLPTIQITLPTLFLCHLLRVARIYPNLLAVRYPNSGIVLVVICKCTCRPIPDLLHVPYPNFWLRILTNLTSGLRAKS